MSPAAPKYIRVAGVVYRRVDLPQRVRYNGSNYRLAVQAPLDQQSQQGFDVDCNTVKASLTEIIKDAQRVLASATKIQEQLDLMEQQVAASLEHNDGRVSRQDVLMLNPEKRVELLQAPVRSMEKANRMLNYTVDSTVSGVKHAIHNLDTMVDSWEAANYAQNAPNTSRELTAPMVMTDMSDDFMSELI